MNEQQPKEKAGAELADYCYAHRDDPDMVGDQVDHVPPRAARVTVRLNLDQGRRIREAAGMTVSAVLRQAGLTATNANVVDMDRLRWET